MDAKLESGEPERREGIGGRVRRFIDTELNRALDKKDRHTDEGDPDYRDAPSRAPESDLPPEPDRPYVDPPARPTHPVTATPVEPTYDSPASHASPASDSPVHGSPVHDSPVHDIPAHDPSVDDAAAGEVRGRSSAEAVADGSAARVGLLNDPAGLRDQWQQVQGTFVDDPQRAVHEASVLVDRTLEEIRQNVARGQTGDPTSTEDLRVSFQRYREFFHRLLSA
ncbi:MAG: hypothetical protein H0V41_19145 [Pseudonocardiales bacterium]|nr:hypothetical protein [Pseudonocardiales bacterium]